MKNFVFSTIFGLFVSFFAQGTVQAQTGWEPISRQKASRVVQDVYRAFLFQAPLLREAEYWEYRIERGSYPVIVDELTPAISNSAQFAEAVNRYGSRAVIDNVYRVLFRRVGGQAAYAAWGGYVERRNYHAFVYGVLAGAEFQQVYGIRQTF